MTGRDARAEAHLLERLWYADGFAGWSARLALLPLEALYGAVVLGRGALYDAGVLRSSPTSLPAVSVGNLTVGGTGRR